MTMYRFRILIVLIIVTAVSPTLAQQATGSITPADEKSDKSVARRPTASSATDNTAPIADPLVRLLVDKGLLTTDEARTVSATGTPGEQRDRLASLLREKGV